MADPITDMDRYRCALMTAHHAARAVAHESLRDALAYLDRVTAENAALAERCAQLQREIDHRITEADDRCATATMHWNELRLLVGELVTLYGLERRPIPQGASERLRQIITTAADYRRRAAERSSDETRGGT